MNTAKIFSLLFFLYTSTVLAATHNLSMDFGFLPVSASRTQTFRLANNGAQSLSQISWNISGDSFTASTNCPTSLLPGKSCDFSVAFWCLREGHAQGALTISTSADQFHIGLSGLGNRVNYPEPRPPEPRP